MSLLAIGDVHGHLDPLLRLLDEAHFAPEEEELWLVGDLVNRGPDSLGVLRWARATSARMGERMVVVLGNHDLHLLAVAAGSRPAKKRDRLDAILRASDRDDLLDWLRRRPLLHRDGGLLLVHAGLLPHHSPTDAAALARRAESALRSGDLAAILGNGDPRATAADELRQAVYAFSRLRTCTARGEPCEHAGPPGDAPTGCLPWFRIPGRRSFEATVVCGHWAALGLHFEPGVLALDSGAAWGGPLTAARLPQGAVYQVPTLGPGR